MKHLIFVLLACFAATGCYHPNANERTYGYNSLKAPVKAAYKPAAQETAFTIPQSVTQPAPAQQPFVQTIVIPQYTPQPVFPANVSYGSSIPAVQNIPITSLPGVPTNASSMLNTGKESVYPSWAAPDYTPPIQNNSSNNNMVLLQNAARNETVQCAVFDSMCINSYRQQGYQQISGSIVQNGKDGAGYPQTVQKVESNIPRW